MGSQQVDILRQGVWASLTGGWYYDPYHKLFTNTVHLYLWLSLLCLPFSLQLYFPGGPWYVWMAYAVAIFLLFVAIKSINWSLHKLFDKGEVHVQVSAPNEEDLAVNLNDIELQNIWPENSAPAQPERGHDLHTTTGPSQYQSVPTGSHDTSFIEMCNANSSVRNRRSGQRNSAHNDATTFDFKVDVHSNSNQAGEDDIDGGSAARKPTGFDDAFVGEWYQVPSRPGRDKDEGDSNVVILVDGTRDREGDGDQLRENTVHTAQAQRVLEESVGNNSSMGLDFSQGDASFSTTSSLLTVAGAGNRTLTGARRFSNISDLARSLMSEEDQRSTQVTREGVTGSLEVVPILSHNQMAEAINRFQLGHQSQRQGAGSAVGGSVRRGVCGASGAASEGARPSARGVRRTLSALESHGLNSHNNSGSPGHMRVGQHLRSFPVSLDYGINSRTDVPPPGPRGSSQMITFGRIKETPSGEKKDKKEKTSELPPIYRGGSDQDLASYEKDLMEATKALLMAGNHLAREVRARSEEVGQNSRLPSYSNPPSEAEGRSPTNSERAMSEQRESQLDKDKSYYSSEPIYMTMKPIRRKPEMRVCSESPGSTRGASSSSSPALSPRDPTQQDSKHLGCHSETTEDKGLDSSCSGAEDAPPGHMSSQEGKESGQGSNSDAGDSSTNLLNSVGKDWLYADSEPELLPASPKQVPVLNHGGADGAEEVEPRDLAANAAAGRDDIGTEEPRSQTELQNQREATAPKDPQDNSANGNGNERSGAPPLAREETCEILASPTSISESTHAIIASPSSTESGVSTSVVDNPNVAMAQFPAIDVTNVAPMASPAIDVSGAPRTSSPIKDDAHVLSGQSPQPPSIEIEAVQNVGQENPGIEPEKEKSSVTKASDDVTEPGQDISQKSSDFKRSSAGEAEECMAPLQDPAISVHLPVATRDMSPTDIEAGANGQFPANINYDVGCPVTENDLVEEVDGSAGRLGRQGSPGAAGGPGDGQIDIAAGGGDQAKVKSRDSSHGGSSGTDTETRALLNKLGEVEANFEAACGGAIPKRRKQGGSTRKGSLYRSSGDSRSDYRRDEYEYEMPDRNTLQDDAVGLKLFLDILNGPENPEAEAELRKLIQKKRNRIGEESLHRREMDTEDEVRLRRRIATRRRRRHHAQLQPEEQFPAPEVPIQEEEEELMKKLRKRERKRRKNKERRQGSSGGGDQVDGRESAGKNDDRSADVHIAEDHNDTSEGAVHCFQDENGKWHTYTFGGPDGCPTSSRVAQSPSTNPPVLGAAGGAPKDGGGDGGTNKYLQSQTSSDSGLTVVLDSPTLVFQPNESQNQQSSTFSGASGVERSRGARDNQSGGSSATQRDTSLWSRDTMISGGRYHVGTGATTQYESPPSWSALRRYNNPLSMFAENFFDRLPGGGGGQGGTTNAAPDLAFTHTYPALGPGGIISQLTRIDETASGSGGQMNLCSGLSGQQNGSQGANTNSTGGEQPGTKLKKYHLLQFPGTKGIKIWMDRLQLISIFDQDPSVWSSAIAVLLATVTAILGSQVLQYGYYHDHWLVLFCLVLASCQYSLVKSVQPDASSPTHGFNTTTVYSRPAYFIILASLILILEQVLQGEIPGFEIYNRKWWTRDQLLIARDFLYGFVLFFPLIFTIGLLPQINTAAMYIMEQIDIHIFGGNAASSIQSSFYCVIRSVLAVCVLVGFAYGGLTERTHSVHAQEVLFSIFISLSVSISYHLSRSSSDPTVLLSIMKRHFMAIISEDDHSVGSSGNPGKSNGGSSRSSADKTPVSNQGEAAAAGSSGDPVLPTAANPNNNGGTNESSTTTTNGGGSTPATAILEDENDLQATTDPLPKKLRDTVNRRLKNDLIICFLTSVLTFLIHQSGVFSRTFPHMDIVLWIIAILAGFALHYFLPHFRKQTPWKCVAAPIMKSNEHGQFEVRQPAKVMWWERILLWANFLEKSILYPLIFISACTQDRAVFKSLFGPWGGSLIMCVALLKCLRNSFSDNSRQYITLLMAILIFQYNPKDATLNNLYPENPRHSPFLVDYLLSSILMVKLTELYLKCQFVITYIAPHQINWGSAFHAFAQPFSVPHSAMLFLQAAIATVLSSPLNPFLGSTIFICSYVRPVKFWERNYNTKRVDNSNTRLSFQVELRNPGADDNNLNSIFYEHLTRSLQHSLAGDIQLGRWGEVQQGDFFVLASDYLNCMVHIIELANGLCTFQVRGLEFRGTYCHQREVEAISEGVEEDEGCCCCEPGHLPYMLSLNAAFGQRWLAWEVSAVKYVLEGYSISDNSAQSMLQVYDLRKILVSYYIKAIIYYTIRSPKLEEWLSNPNIRDSIKMTSSKTFVDLDPLFNSNIDEDFDFRASGITRNSFCNAFLPWIQHCAQARDPNFIAGKGSEVVSLCLALSLLGRRALGAAGHNALSTVEFFLVGLHALFKGDFRITSVRDEWVFSDMELLRKVVAPAIRMSLKLHQDHFMSPDEYEASSVLYEAISNHERDLVISHEGDPAWRTAVLSGAPSLLALRHVIDEGSDEYKIIMLNKRYLSFRVIKLNRECVRGLWAGQQQELIFLRNRNPERGSIQNAKQALRNIINSSCDQPIGYPIYVSPLTTSYIDTHNQVASVIGGPISLGAIKSVIIKCWNRVKERCVEGCSSGSAGVDCDLATAEGVSTDGNRGGSLQGANRASVVSSASKPSSGTLASLAGLLGAGGQLNQAAAGAQLTHPANSSLDRQHQANSRHRNVSDDSTGSSTRLGQRTTPPPQLRARILDPNLVYDNINLGRRIDPVWPDPEWRAKGGRNSWNNWVPMEDMVGTVVHKWAPLHPLTMHRSHTDRAILLLKIEDKYVPIAEHAVQIFAEPPEVPPRLSSRNTSQSGTTDNPDLNHREDKNEVVGPEAARTRKVLAKLPRVIAKELAGLQLQETPTTRDTAVTYSPACGVALPASLPPTFTLNSPIPPLPPLPSLPPSPATLLATLKAGGAGASGQGLLLDTNGSDSALSLSPQTPDHDHVVQSTCSIKVSEALADKDKTENSLELPLPFAIRLPAIDDSTALPLPDTLTTAQTGSPAGGEQVNRPDNEPLLENSKKSNAIEDASTIEDASSTPNVDEAGQPPLKNNKGSPAVTPNADGERDDCVTGEDATAGQPEGSQTEQQPDQDDLSAPV